MSATNWRIAQSPLRGVTGTVANVLVVVTVLWAWTTLIIHWTGWPGPRWLTPTALKWILATADFGSSIIKFCPGGILLWILTATVIFVINFVMPVLVLILSPPLRLAEAYGVTPKRVRYPVVIIAAIVAAAAHYDLTGLHYIDVVTDYRVRKLCVAITLLLGIPFVRLGIPVVRFGCWLVCWWMDLSPYAKGGSVYIAAVSIILANMVGWINSGGGALWFIICLLGGLIHMMPHLSTEKNSSIRADELADFLAKTPFGNERPLDHRPQYDGLTHKLPQLGRRSRL